MRVMVADQDAEVRSALRLLVTHVLGMQVVGEVADAAGLWAQMQDARPDLLLLEWGQRGTGQPAKYPHMRVIVLSCRPEERQQALAVGADAFVCKADSP